MPTPHEVSDYVHPVMLEGLNHLGDAYGDERYWYEVVLQDERPENRWRALLVLAARGYPDARPDLADESYHENSRIRAWACFAMGASRQRLFRGDLERHSGDPVRRVRFRAYRALAALGFDPNILPVAGEDNLTVLISDDDEAARETIAGILREAGIPCTTAATVEETVAKAASLSPAIVVTDNQKGADNTAGLHMAARFARDRHLQAITLVMLSDDRVGGPFLWYGGDHYLHKTRDLKHLVPLVNLLLRV